MSCSIDKERERPSLLSFRKWGHIPFRWVESGQAQSRYLGFFVLLSPLFQILYEWNTMSNSFSLDPSGYYLNTGIWSKGNLMLSQRSIWKIAYIWFCAPRPWKYTAQRKWAHGWRGLGAGGAGAFAVMHTTAFPFIKWGISATFFVAMSWPL